MVSASGTAEMDCFRTPATVSAGLTMENNEKSTTAQLEI